jgi:hypothetical protein
LISQRSPAAAVISLFGWRIQAASALDPRLPAFAAAKQLTERRRFPRRSILHNPRCKPRQHIDHGELRDFMLDSSAATPAAYRAVMELAISC